MICTEACLGCVFVWFNVLWLGLSLFFNVHRIYSIVVNLGESVLVEVIFFNFKIYFFSDNLCFYFI